MKKIFSAMGVFSALIFAGLIYLIAYNLGIHLTLKLTVFSILSGLSYNFCAGLLDFMKMISTEQGE